LFSILYSDHLSWFYNYRSAINSGISFIKWGIIYCGCGRRGSLVKICGLSGLKILGFAHLWSECRAGASSAGQWNACTGLLRQFLWPITVCTHCAS